MNEFGYVAKIDQVLPIPGAEIICLSGRDSQCRSQTKEWLDGYVREIKELETCTNNIKKNIHACLVGKRKSCYGYKAIDPWEEF